MMRSSGCAEATDSLLVIRWRMCLRRSATRPWTSNTIAEGLVDTEEQWAKFPADVRGHLDVMHKMLFKKVKPAR